MAARGNDLDARANVRSAGLRVTAPRVAALEYLSEASHSTVDGNRGAGPDQLGSVSRQAVYDVVSGGVDAGIVRRLVTPGAAARYEIRTDDGQRHVICRSCR